jgi:hypothetical protein
MSEIGAGFGPVVQVAYLVPDIDVAMDHWLRHLGLGPWTNFRNIELATNFDGRDFTLRIHEALAYQGNLQIQLVQSLNAPEVETPYSDWIRKGRYGVHHVAYFTENVDSDVERARKQGFERICSMKDKGGFRYFYLQSTAMPEVWIEFLESYPMLREIFASGIAEAAKWDGTNPIRRIEYKDL